MHNILHYVPTKLSWKARTNGGEHAGPCPWCGGRDRFRVWPNAGAHGRFWCRQCGRSGDTLTLLQELDGLSFEAACRHIGRVTDPPARYQPRSGKPLVPPSKIWRNRAWSLTETCIEQLWTERGRRARNWLMQRGLTAS